MTRTAILTPNLNSADAVSNDVLAMERLLTERGHEVSVFAENSNLTSKEVMDPDVVKSYLRQPDDVLIYHHSIGWDAGLKILKTVPCRKIIKYHNITPAGFFEGISEEHQNLCLKGRAQLEDIVNCCADLYLAASAFNKHDFTVAGSDPRTTFVVPPFHHADQLQTGTANLEVLDQYRDGNVNLLTVGGIRPNKGHAALIEAFAIYYYHFNAQARLFVVGAQNSAFAAYTSILRQLIGFWSIEERVVFTGEVPIDSLKSYYLLADALLITSAHEGFCVPLVEAMAMKVPIVAYGSTAIPETVRDAGLIWDWRDPYLIAQSIDSFLANESAKMAMVFRGSQRYEQYFSNSAIEERFLRATVRAGFQF
jgi:glycosyltransferase involved in cell wall biosynthesis